MSDKRIQTNDIKPFLSWAGSKRKLIRHLDPLIPQHFDKYFEPFLGGGALFFHLQPKRAEISDASYALVETYRAVKAAPDQLLKLLRPLKPTRENFDRIKLQKPRSEVNRAAQFIFLNKSCWNGLYRVNAAGIFNVPFGQPKSDFIVDEANLQNCSRQLRRREVSLRCQDFEEISTRVGEGDFVFLDPPYVTSHNLNGFADWNEKLFRWKDQVRLAAMARTLVEKRANVLITNADHTDVRDLYPGFGTVSFRRASTLANDTKKRRQTSELILFGGPHYESKGQDYGGGRWREQLSS
ncbi:DNA adenine methylase [Reyranella massiliensis]|uniref:DNA adenine methylase n=1 Tax=Reyranella massiliensis TaxID=445220 RepID=UPI0006ACFD63|nr:Dam family site-specific DNA-(adenine-N6)-methyltransferase [Reyranella massiliensis]